MREAERSLIAPTRATGLAGLTVAVASISADIRTALAEAAERRKP